MQNGISDTSYEYRKFNIKEYYFFGIVVLLNIAVLIFLTDKFSSYAVITIYIIFLLSCLYSFNIRSVPLYLFIVSILPLAYLDNRFHYVLSYLAIQNIPLSLLFLYSIYELLYRSKNLEFQIPYSLRAILIYVALSFVLFILGLVRGASFSLSFNELYQNFYFFFAIIIYLLFKNRREYIIAFYWVIFVFIIISLEYIIFNFNNDLRFTTFQNHFLPFVTAALFAAMLFMSHRYFKKLLLGVLLIIVIWGSISTETRTLLVSNVFSILIVALLYFRKKFTGTKKYIYTILFSIVVLIPVFTFRGDSSLGKANTAEKRFQAIATPTEDLAFLMRIEAVYLGTQKFLKHPVIGEGFGTELRLKWLLKTSYLLPDNSFLYYLLKGGIVFFLIALWMYWRLIRGSYDILRYSNSEFAKYMAVSIIAGMMGIFLTGMLNANLVHLN